MPLGTVRSDEGRRFDHIHPQVLLYRPSGLLLCPFADRRGAVERAGSARWA
ncbi:hypothetical protein [Nocardiopsis rhodophaea]|uniref:hypothetical protein n=1 Tax=Nocardiopsis rhodophaea TaxID=280238 RepID=UPI0031D38011